MPENFRSALFSCLRVSSMTLQKVIIYLPSMVVFIPTLDAPLHKSKYR